MERRDLLPTDCSFIMLNLNPSAAVPNYNISLLKAGLVVCSVETGEITNIKKHSERVNKVLGN